MQILPQGHASQRSKDLKLPLDKLCIFGLYLVMWLPIEIRGEAVLLRKKGYSIKEVANKLNVAKGTASLWLRNVVLGKKALARLEKRRILGQYKTIFIKRKKRERETRERFNRARLSLRKIPKNKEVAKLACALMFWCEGGKLTDTQVQFINSDPLLIQTFVELLRKGFKIDEKKFRILMHLHGYHSERKCKQLWSHITQIPKTQFTKSYLKPNNRTRIRRDYMGSIRISYYDASLVKDLKAIYKTFAYQTVT